MPQRRSKSVRFTILFWSTGILAVCLLGFCGIFRELLRVRLLSLVDTHLSERTSGLIHLWASIPLISQEAMREEMNAGRFGNSLFIPEQAANAPDAPLPDESLTGIYRPRAIALDGKSYFRSINDSVLDRLAFHRSVLGETVHSTVTIRGNQVRVISVPVSAGGEIEFVMQSARDLKEYQAELDVVTSDLLRAIPIVLLLSFLGGLLLTNRAMTPVKLLRQATEKVEAQDLSQRLPIVGTDDFAQLTITLNNMLERLELAFKHQSQFIADASHELRTPLTVLRGNTSLALVGERTAADYKGTIERTHRTITSMSRLVDELLLLSRADSGEMLTIKTSVNIVSAVQIAVETETRHARELMPVQVISEITELMVSGNIDLLTRLFANLLGNAIRHTEPDKSITATISREQNNALIVIADEGEGIPSNHINHVTERFYRADSARSGHEGSGLGLSICMSIVTAHNGSLLLTSEMGKGTKAYVRIPLLT